MSAQNHFGTSLSVCIEVCVCTRVQLASWSTAVRWEYVKKSQGDNSSSSLLLQWGSNTRSPAVVLCHLTAKGGTILHVSCLLLNSDRLENLFALHVLYIRAICTEKLLLFVFYGVR